MAVIFTAASSQVIQCGDATDVRDLATFTMMAWIKPTANGASNIPRVGSKEAYGASPAGGWQWIYSNAGGTLGVSAMLLQRKRATAEMFVVAGDNTVTQNVWQHVAVTVSDAACVHYVNGLDAGYKTNTVGSGAFISDSGYNLDIGNRDNLNRGFEGYIEDVRIYNRVLTQHEIAAISVRRGTCIADRYGLLGWWRMAELKPTATCATCYDDTDYKRNGSSSGSPTYGEGLGFAKRR